MNKAPIGEIQIIAGGFAGGGVSTFSRKAYARRVRYEKVYVTNRAPKHQRLSNQMTVSFGEEDWEGVLYPHDDALVVTLVIANYITRRVLIDNESSANILFLEAFVKMGISANKLTPSPTPLKGFFRDTIQPAEAITLPVTTGTGELIATTMTDFLVVKAPSSFNAILGRQILNHLKAITSTYHLKMKFPTECKVIELQGEQALAWECYVQELKDSRSKVYVVEGQNEALVPSLPPPLMVAMKKGVEVRDEQKQQHVEANEPLELVTLYLDRPRTTTQIGTQVPSKDKEALKQMLIEHRDVFAWSHEDMLGIDNNVIEHSLCVDPAHRAIHQKMNFFQFKEGYNQIRMHAANEEKTSFIMDRELYCYQVMPFELKNAGATYQRLVNRMFNEQIGRSMEVYVDNLLVKSKEPARHLDDLRKAFGILRHYKMRLNPAKCAFGVESKKFLGFIVSERGIEASPDKIGVILNMKPPRNLNKT
ncbi:uncharacterized protein LOC122306375 [Carya illinoinensis]|uniref:uncharacterized protein LOC122306375 n=1 Tax=Carya illinoinensis TaxID=32201 RepID=UPI001C71F751|nr:uncharacterized protein LOC122306375 [Carya illinoinensis]